ncbi:MAG: hypothetical protein Kow00121_29530 [Elainellaceae cyanobacterium]
MAYLTDPADIRSLITEIASYPILWLDTEVADWQIRQSKLSLIQVLADPRDLTGDAAYLLDVLHKPDVVQYFIDQIMVNPNIEKVFHNASFDLKFLGQSQAQNVTCTLRMSRRISLKKLGTSNRKLKTLARELCYFTNVDEEQQTSDWGRRPLSPEQLLYAKMDTVYLAQVHQYLLRFSSARSPMPTPVVNTVDLPSFSVTQVRLAWECPRLFYLTHHFGGMTVFLPEGQALGIGSAFHDLSEQLVRTILIEPQFQQFFQSPAEQLNFEAIATQMQALLYDRVFFPYLQAVTQKEPGKATAVVQLWQGLTSLIRHWARLLVSNRKHCRAEELVAKTFLAQELSIEHTFTLPNGTRQLIRGRFDSLVYDFEQHRLCVVEYKTYQPPDPSAQLAQVALYSYMLREKIGVPIDSAVYAVLPNWQELTFRWDELEKTVHQLIPHKLQQMQQWVGWQQGQPEPPPATSQVYLCEICPQRTQCQSFFSIDASPKRIAQPALPASEPVLPVPPPIAATASVDVNTSVDVDAIATQLVQTLQAFKVDVEYQGSILAPAFIRVKLKPSLGTRVNSLLKFSDDLKVQLGLKAPPLIAPQVGYVSVDLPRPDRQSALFEHYLQRQFLPATAPTQIAIGVDLEGQLIEADLSDPNTCHFLVGGTTGSGKSEFLRSLLLSLLVRHAPEHLQIALVDPKRVTFPEFEQMRWLHTPIVKDSDRAIELMERLVTEMEQRYQRFEQAQCADLTAYNQKAQPLPRIVCIFDEYADFMVEKETRNALELSIKRLGAMARAAGIHLIIATQRPEAKVVTPLIRSNLPGRVALRTATEADSAIILGGKKIEAAYLLGKGDLLYQSGANLYRLQSLFAQAIELPLLQ